MFSNNKWKLIGLEMKVSLFHRNTSHILGVKLISQAQSAPETTNRI